MIIGSNVFFKDIDGFVSKDTDILELVDNPTGFKIVRQIKFPNKCVFQWKRMNAQEFIDATFKHNVPMAIGKFLIPEFNNEIGVTIEHLKQLQPLVEKLDDKHLYEKIIYDSYILNNDFYLTEEQLKNAYNEYKKYR